LIMKLICVDGSSPCIIDMASVSLDVQMSDGKVITQYFLIRAINVPVSTDTPFGVVVWACMIGEFPYSHQGFNIDDMLKIVIMKGILEMEIFTGRSNETSGASFESWFDDEFYASQMKNMYIGLTQTIDNGVKSR